MNLNACLQQFDSLRGVIQTIREDENDSEIAEGQGSIRVAFAVAVAWCVYSPPQLTIDANNVVWYGWQQTEAQSLKWINDWSQFPVDRGSPPSPPPFSIIMTTIRRNEEKTEKCMSNWLHRINEAVPCYCRLWPLHGSFPSRWSSRVLTPAQLLFASSLNYWRGGSNKKKKKKKPILGFPPPPSLQFYCFLLHLQRRNAPHRTARLEMFSMFSTACSSIDEG